MATRIFGAMLRVLVTPRWNRAVSHIHSADLEGERSQLRSGRGTARRTSVVKKASDISAIPRQINAAPHLAAVYDSRGMVAPPSSFPRSSLFPLLCALCVLCVESPI